MKYKYIGEKLPVPVVQGVKMRHLGEMVYETETVNLDPRLFQPLDVSSKKESSSKKSKKKESEEEDN